MRTSIIAVLATSALVLAACGSDSDSGGGEAQSELTSMLTESLDEMGVPYDEDCIEDTISRFSDEDAETLVAAGVDGNPEMSDEADAIADSIQDCFEMES